MEYLIIAILSVLLSSCILYMILNRKRKKAAINKEAIILLERVHKACKLITVEGNFTEILDHKENGSILWGFISQEKRALLIVKAKVSVGFDLTKVSIKMDAKNKLLTIQELPKPKIIAIETDVKYYDIQESVFNKFASEDHTKLQEEAKKLIRDKVPETHLPELAKEQGLETIKLIQEIAGALGWKLIKEQTNNNFIEVDVIQTTPIHKLEG